MEIKISFNQCQAVIEQMRMSKRMLLQECNEIQLVQVQLKYTDDEALQTVAYKLQKQMDQLMETINHISKLRRTLERILELYNGTENSIIDFEDVSIRREHIIIKLKNIPNVNTIIKSYF